MRSGGFYELIHSETLRPDIARFYSPPSHTLLIAKIFEIGHEHPSCSDFDVGYVTHSHRPFAELIP